MKNVIVEKNRAAAMKNGINVDKIWAAAERAASRPEYVEGLFLDRLMAAAMRASMKKFNNRKSAR